MNFLRKHYKDRYPYPYHGVIIGAEVCNKNCWFERIFEAPFNFDDFPDVNELKTKFNKYIVENLPFSYFDDKPVNIYIILKIWGIYEMESSDENNRTETLEEFFKNRILFNEVNRSNCCIDYISNVFKPEVFNF